MMTSSQDKPPYSPATLDVRFGPRVFILLLLLGATALLLYDLTYLSLSVDEFVNVQIDRGSWSAILQDLRGGKDLHPPLSHVAMKLWITLFGDSDWSVRSLWAMVGVLNVALAYQLGKRWLGAAGGLVAALLLVSTPTFLLFTRFEKYYSLTIALSLLTLLTGLRLWRQPQWRNALFYGLALVALLYTDYLGPLVLIVSQDLLLTLYDRRWTRIRYFLAAQLVAGFLYLPWLLVFWRQASTLGAGGVADLGRNWQGLGLKLTFLWYSFSLGETLLPWRMVAVLGIVAAGTLTILGTLRILRSVPSSVPSLRAFWIITFAAGLLGTALIVNVLFPSVPFVAFPNHVLFLLPLFVLLLTSGWMYLPQRWLGTALLVTLLCVRGVGIANYFSGIDFHNPIYAVPMRTIVQAIADEAKPGELVLSEFDTGFAYYLTQYEQNHGPLRGASYVVRNPSETITYLQAQSPESVWLLIFGRDRTRNDTMTALAEWLQTRDYRLTEQMNYVEQDEFYQRIKTTLFGRKAYSHKLVLQRYDRD